MVGSDIINTQTPKTPFLTVDIIIMSPKDTIVLIKRKYDPYKSYWALPGGFVEIGESVEQAAVREAWEETGLNVELVELVGVYSNPDRDPRGHTVTIVYIAQTVFGNLKADSDAEDAFEFTKDEISDLKLAFDHKTILKNALNILNKRS
ncbi:MAG: NUDIX hydrolase [Methanobacteriaceae archaeon]|nr:NUDIX hydrolase [Methanobacteriaceae archaeon]MDO9628067.1 NUDIX hydrolase [Methanobacteriaceae archaeon]